MSSLCNIFLCGHLIHRIIDINATQASPLAGCWMKYTADRGHNYATLLPRCLSQNCFLPRPSPAPVLQCGHTPPISGECEDVRDTVAAALSRTFGLSLSLSLCLCCGVVGELLPSRNVVTRAEGGIVRLSLAGDLGGVCPLWLLSSSPTGLSISRQSAQQAAHYYCYLPSSGQ